MPREHVTTDPEPPARSVWRRRLRRRRRLAWASLVVLAIPIALIGLSRVLSIGYRDGYRMIELRDGMVGYYSNPGYKRFVWLDRGREEGWLLSGPAKVPPAPYRLYSASRSLVQIYVKLWHVSALLAAISATLWWRARGQEKAGRCFACGYDLRGIPRGGTAGHGLVSCPECGAVDDDGLNTTPHHPDQPAGSSLAARGVIFAGGGTGGHIFPGIAIAERLEASGAPPRVRACFAVSTREIDARILGHAGRSFTVIPAEPFSLRPLALWRFVSSWGKSVRAGRKVIREARALCPGGVELVATGGFVAAPMVQAARAEGVGVTLVNLDTVPGRANRWIGRHAARIFSAAPLHGDPLGGSSRIEFVPPIVRSAALAPADAAQCRRMLGLDPGRPTLLVTGASQGARSINAFMAEYAGSRREVLMRDSWQLIHQTGRGEAGDVRALYESLGIPAVVEEFFDAMGSAWGAADLALTRCGAGSVAEAWANRVPAVMLPYPYHKDQHQRRNAEVLAAAGVVILAQDHVDPGRNLEAIGPVLDSLLADAGKVRRMRDSFSALGPADGAERIAGSLAAAWGR